VIAVDVVALVAAVVVIAEDVADLVTEVDLAAVEAEEVVEVIAEAVVAAEEHQEVDVVPHAEVDAVVLVPEVAQRPLLSPIAMAVSSLPAERRTCW
jgi:hypothetical protein